MKVTSYGLFWRMDEIDWFPGQGAKNQFRLMGRIGANRGSLNLADFRKQQGIYILYDEYGAVYVGLTKKQGLGTRLKQHTTDDLADKWSRFSWFGFNPVIQREAGAMHQVSDQEEEVTEDKMATIGELEALIIRLIDPRYNRSRMKFPHAQEWKQVAHDECEKYLNRLG